MGQPYGLIAQYKATPPTLNDGDYTPIMTDNKGRVILGAGALATGQTYTVTNPVTARSLNVSTATTTDVAQVMGTLINDLKAVGILS